MSHFFYQNPFDECIDEMEELSQVPSIDKEHEPEHQAPSYESRRSYRKRQVRVGLVRIA